MTLKTLDNLVAIGQLKPEPPDRQEFDSMLQSARRSLQDVQV
jgi:hypothetical protein